MLFPGIGLVAAYENNCPGGDRSSHAIQSAEALSQGVETRALGYKTIEVEVGPYFQSLGSHDDHRFCQRTLIGQIGSQEVQALPNDCVLIDRTHAASE